MYHGRSIVYPVSCGVVTTEGRKQWERALPSLVEKYYETVQQCARVYGVIGAGESWSDVEVTKKLLLGGCGGTTGEPECGGCGRNGVGSSTGGVGDQVGGVGDGDGCFGMCGGKCKVACGGKQADGFCATVGSGGTSLPFVGGECVEAAGVETVLDNVGIEVVNGDTADQKVESVGGSGSLSAKTLANRERRQKKKELKRARQVGMKRDDWRVKEGLVASTSLGAGRVAEKTELRVSLEQKWMAENAVAIEKAKQNLELIKLRDIAKEAKKREVVVTRQTECNKVAIEQAFGSLKATGNVPGFCETVVSDTVPSLTSGSISPNSSVSEAEVRKVVKELEDLKVENAKLKRRIRDRNISDLRGGDTVAFSADMSEGLRKEIDEACDGMPTEYDIPEDPDTIYVKKYGEFQFQ